MMKKHCSLVRDLLLVHMLKQLVNARQFIAIVTRNFVMTMIEMKVENFIYIYIYMTRSIMCVCVSVPRNFISIKRRIFVTPLRNHLTF
jgi:hypothetical protein